MLTIKHNCWGVHKTSLTTYELRLGGGHANKSKIIKFLDFYKNGSLLAHQIECMELIMFLEFSNVGHKSSSEVLRYLKI